MGLGANAQSEFRPTGIGGIPTQSVTTHGGRLVSVRGAVPIALAILLYCILADAAFETLFSGAAVRWLIGATVTVYAAGTVLLWRRLGWIPRATASYVVLLVLFLLTAWHASLTGGLRLFGQSTDMVLSSFTAVAVLLSGAILLTRRRLPLAAGCAIGFAALYGFAAFIDATARGMPFANIFHGQTLWARLPFWLQGPSIGAFVLVPAAAIIQIATGYRLRGQRLGLRALQVASLAVAVTLAVAGLSARLGLGYGPTETRGRAGLVRLSAITFAQGESGSGPLGQAVRFQQGAKAIYAFLNFEGLSRDDSVGAVWYKGGIQLAEQNFKMSELYGSAVPSRGHLRFILELDHGAESGVYFLEISVSDVLAQVGILPVDPSR